MATYFVIITKIASLAHSHGVEQSIFMNAVPGILVSTILPVAG